MAPVSIAFAAALAAGGSDTVASEIGKAWGTRTFYLVPPRLVPPGTSGAMSLEGTAAGLVGALALGALAVGLGLVPAAALLPVVVGATVGSLAESVLGATLEAPGILNNDVLNFINTAIAALRRRRGRDERSAERRRARACCSSSRGRSRWSLRRSASLRRRDGGRRRAARAWSTDLLVYPADRLTDGGGAQRRVERAQPDLRPGDRSHQQAEAAAAVGAAVDAEAWTFTVVTYAVALVLAWLVAPGGRHECFWIVVVATVITFSIRCRRSAPSGSASGPT